MYFDVEQVEAKEEEIDANKGSLYFNFNEHLLMLNLRSYSVSKKKAT